MTRDEQILKAGEEITSNPFELEGFIEGAEWADRTMLDKVCEWLDNNLPLYWGEVNANNTERFVKLFKKAMENENKESP